MLGTFNAAIYYSAPAFDLSNRLFKRLLLKGNKLLLTALKEALFDVF